jgi:hypothetical protein
MFFVLALVALPWLGALALGAYGVSHVPPRAMMAMVIAVPWLVALTFAAHLIVATLACAAVDCGLLPRLMAVRRVRRDLKVPTEDSVVRVCPICLCAAAPPDAETACGHGFHAACIARWAARAHVPRVSRGPRAPRGARALRVVRPRARRRGAGAGPHALKALRSSQGGCFFWALKPNSGEFWGPAQ